MKLRIVVSLLALSTVFGLSTKAQELPKIDVSANYSYFRANPATPGFGNFSLNGGSATAAYNFRDWLSAVADFGGYDVVSEISPDHALWTCFGRWGAGRFGGVRNHELSHSASNGFRRWR